MPNEFIIKNGYRSQGNSEITGSLKVTGGITGSLFGTASWAENAITASYALPLSQSVVITGSLLLTSSYISVVDYIDFNNTGIPTPTDQEGRIYWDEDNGTLSLGMHGGQVVQQIGLEEYFYVKNQTGTTLLNGTVTYASGTLGASGRIIADLMIADGTIPYFYTLGITTEDIVNGDEGYVTQFGLVRGINTTGSNGETWADGDILYVSPTVPGTLTKFEPEAPNLRLQMAIVIRAATNGSIFVRPDLGSDVGSLHDVINTTTTASYGELFVKSGSVWTSIKQLTGSYGLTGSLDITGSVNITSNTVISGSLNVLNLLENTSTALVSYNTSSGLLSYTNDPIIDTLIVNSDLSVGGNFIVTGSVTYANSITTTTRRITTPTASILASDYRLGIRYTQTGSVQLLLPKISEIGERDLQFKDEEGNANINNITIIASGSDLIDGSTTAILDRNYIGISLYNDGISNWYIE